MRICLVGLGRTGKELAKTILENDSLELVSVICSPNSNKKGICLSEIIGTNDTKVVVDVPDNIAQNILSTKPDVVVDFSNAKATLENAKIFSKMEFNLVIGTTGFSEAELFELYSLTKKYNNGIVYAPNITVGVNMLMIFSNLAASILSNYDFQITEIHHRNKKDIPSGTAIKIAKEIEKGSRISGYNVAGSTPINAVRAGGVIGKHEVMIVGENDKIEISHESFSRKAFALGAVRAIEFIAGKSGYFEMKDVLNLKKIMEKYLESESKTERQSTTPSVNF